MVTLSSMPDRMSIQAMLVKPSPRQNGGNSAKRGRMTYRGGGEARRGNMGERDEMGEEGSDDLSEGLERGVIWLGHATDLDIRVVRGGDDAQYGAHDGQDQAQDEREEDHHHLCVWGGVGGGGGR